MKNMEVRESIFWESVVFADYFPAPLSVIAMAIVFWKGNRTMGTVGCIITMVNDQLARWFKQGVLKKNFDENGRRK